MAAPQHNGLGRRGWLVLAVAAAGGVIGGVVLERSGAPVPVPSFVTPSVRGGGMLEPAPAPSPPPESAPVAALAGLPSYPGAEPRSLGDGIMAGGVPMAVAYFVTPDPPQDVMAFYRNALQETHEHVLHEWMTPTTGYVGWHDKKTGDLHGVVFRREGEKTMVFPSAAAPARMFQNHQTMPDYLPNPKDAEGTMVVKMGAAAGGSRQLSVVTTVPLTTVGQLLDFYKQGFKGKGWQVEKAVLNTPDLAHVTASRPDMRAETYLHHVSDDGSGPRVEVYVVLTTRDHA